MMTGDAYRKSLDDGRATYFEGKRVDDLPGHPVLGGSVDVVARNYDRWYAPGPEALLNALPPLLADVVASIGKTGMAVAAIIGITLDNLIPGTPRERGLAGPSLLVPEAGDIAEGA